MKEGGSERLGIVFRRMKAAESVGSVSSNNGSREKRRWVTSGTMVRYHEIGIGS